eukprot:NODE_12042_length_526_cov_11.702233_g11754_i0.p1 GENE.NODE_12042_length_526_cov_11.702233_g11754_i0~~NODE_12042_length_526_cov_11.702233_g11754_i0.p1  ORF type:complete len:139 (-),score=36.36 NODE_12042_length_526_cov_11.702233_g11754_i0:108-470(-)
MADSVIPPRITHEKNVVRVTSSRPAYLYVHICKELLHEGQPEVELSGLGTSINAVVACVEMLKSRGLVEVTSIRTSLSEEDEWRHAVVPKLQTFVKKSADFDTAYAQMQKWTDAEKMARE